MLRYRLTRYRYKFRRWISYQLKLLRAPKASRPVIRLVHEKMDKATTRLASDIGNQLYGSKKLDGLGAITNAGSSYADLNKGNK